MFDFNPLHRYYEKGALKQYNPMKKNKPTNVEISLKTLFSGSGIKPIYSFLIPRIPLVIPPGSSQEQIEKSVAITKESLEKQIVNFQTSKRRRGLFTVCEYTCQTVQAGTGMHVYPRHQQILIIDVQDDSVNITPLIFMDKFLRIKALETITRPQNQEQWYIRFENDVLVPIDWEVFELLDPSVIN